MDLLVLILHVTVLGITSALGLSIELLRRRERGSAIQTVSVPAASHARSMAVR